MENIILTEKLKALILAGGKSKHALHKITKQEFKTLMTINEINSRPLIHNLLEAMRQCVAVSKIYISAPEKVQDEMKDSILTDVIFTPSGNSLMNSLKQGIYKLIDEPYILISTSDLPVITRQNITNFINDCFNIPGFDIYYSIINKNLYTKRFPQNDLRRIYAHLVEGSFTGGNLFLINPKVIIDCEEIIEQFIMFRKHPIKMARILGKRILVKYLKKYLSIRDLEKMVPDYLKGYKGKAIPADPEIALDIDKPIQLEALKSLLERNARENMLT